MTSQIPNNSISNPELDEKDKKYIEYGIHFNREETLRNRSERILTATIILSVLNAGLELDIEIPIVTNEIKNLLNDFLLVIIFALAVLSTIIELKAREQSKIGDFGRRAAFSLNLFSSSFRTIVEEDVIRKGIDLNTHLFEKSYENERSRVDPSVSLFKAKIFTLYRNVFKLKRTREYYQGKVKRKYLPIWVSLAILILFALAVGSKTLSDVVFSFLTLFAVSPFAIETINVMRHWDEKSSILDIIMTRLLGIENEFELSYLFLEYSVDLQEMLKVPSDIFNSNFVEISNDLREAIKTNIEDFEKASIIFTESYLEKLNEIQDISE